LTVTTIPSSEAITPEAALDYDRGNPEVWRALYYFNLYRLVLAGCLLTLALTETPIASFGDRWPTLFTLASLALGVMGVLNIITINRGKPGVRTQAQIQISADLVLITLLMHASGGVSSGLGLLLIVSVAAGGVVLSGRGTLLNAAIATSLVLVEHTLNLFLGYSVGGYTQAGLLGVGLFTTGLAVYVLAYRIRRTEDLAQSQAIDIANLAQVNELIVERLDTGVVVTDQEGRVRHINRTARKLLHTFRKARQTPLSDIAPGLASAVESWNESSGDRISPVQLSPDGPKVMLRILRLADETGKSALIFLEDSTATERQAQQLKLAALGRLSAAIAHEIRNPLGAVSHAGQLLAESPLPDPQSKRLVKIVQDQSTRINEVIETVLQLGRRRGSNPEQIELLAWLFDFIKSLVETRHIDPEAIEITGPAIMVCMDPGHLNQIVTNLCENAIRHSPPYDAKPLITLATRAATGERNAVLDVIDYGSGIPAELVEEIFEPFFTIDAKGTGLGLYVARDLCEANQGRLDYLPSEQGAHFRITFGPDSLCENSA